MHHLLYLWSGIRRQIVVDAYCLLPSAVVGELEQAATGHEIAVADTNR